MEERLKYLELLIDACNGTVEVRAEKWEVNSNLIQQIQKLREEKLAISECSY